MTKIEIGVVVAVILTLAALIVPVCSQAMKYPRDTSYFENGSLQEFEYEGHQYIRFIDLGSTLGVCHKGNCDGCKKRR